MKILIADDHELFLKGLEMIGSWSAPKIIRKYSRLLTETKILTSF